LLPAGSQTHVSSWQIDRDTARPIGLAPLKKGLFSPAIFDFSKKSLSMARVVY
jgi:hypothetical protein